MAEETTQTQAPATPSPASAAPAAPEPAKTGQQAIEESRGRPAGKPMSARDFSRHMGLGGGNTEALITEAARTAAPRNPAATQEPTAPTQEPVAPAEGGAATETAEPRTKENRAGEQQPMDEQGKYQTKGPGAEEAAGTTDGAAEEPGAPTEPDATPEGSQTETAATEATEPAVPEGMVRITIPEDLQRNFGPYQDVPKDQEDFFRFNLNNRVRNREIEELRQSHETELATLRQQMEQLQSRDLQAQATTEAAEKFKETDQYKAFSAEFAKLKAAEEEGFLEEGTASRYWQQAVQPAFKDFESGILTEKQQAIEDQAADSAGEAWANEMWDRANKLPSVVTQLPGFEAEFDASMDAFGYEIERGRYDHFANDPDRAAKLSEAFTQFFYSRLTLRPEMREAIQRSTQEQQEAQQRTAEAERQAAEARAQREAQEAQRKAAEEAARNAATNPMGNVPSGQVVRDADGSAPKINARTFDRMMSRRG